MRCPGCDTPLWKVRPRRCPACDRPFKPSDFRFRPRTVRFCCPHCEQGYLGDGPEGLPAPRRFECVFCGRVIDADEMVLEVAEGVAEHQTRPDTLPWVEAHRSWPVRWGLTAWLGARDPARLMRLTPPGLGERPAVAFAIVTLGAGALAIALAAWLLGAALSVPAISHAAAGVRGLTTLLALLAASVVLLVAWVALIVAAGRPDARALTRTRAVQAVCLTSLPHALWFVPGLGLWVGWLGTLAWARAATLALGASGAMDPRRARSAGLAWPLVCVALWVLVAGASAVGVLPRLGAGPGSWGASAGASVGRFDGPIRAAVERGQTPVHPAELMADGAVTPGAFCADASQTTTAGIDLVGTTLEAFAGLAPARQLAVIQQASAQAPGVPAQRLGDFVFIFDALGAQDAGLWLVVEAPDPAHNPSGGPVHALHPDGSVRTIPAAEVVRALRDQNRLRVRHALPTLRDPRTVRAGDPGG
ncbi:MAG: hypothetical protein IT431_03120 [Phycisphaerales bacterium]|nr:hypothetical protein [Phycisphaerales bacterium]